MSQKNPMTLFLSVKPQKWFIVSCILLLIFIANKFAFPAQASASAVPGGNIQNSIVRAVDIDKPAVVRILTTLNGTLTVHFPNQGSATFPLNGGKYKVELSGSGAFISSHGDILTADHVVQPPHDSTMDNVIQGLAAADIATYINQNFTPATPYNSAEVYSDLNFGVFDSQAQYDAPTSEVYLSTDYTGLINATTLASTPQSMRAPVDKIEGKSSVDQNDVAIVHVKMEDTPSIPLGDSTAVAQQDNLTIIGFPGNGDIGNIDKPDPTSYLTSSVNQVYVSSIKQNSYQGTLIQVGGNVEHGDSGAPALDSKGNIVGVASFNNGNADPPVGTSFLQASSSAQDLLSLLPSVDVKPGKFQTAWQQAFTQYASNSTGHWHRASKDFQAIQTKYPDFQVVAAFADYTAEQAKHETLAQSSSPLTYLVPLIIAVIAIVIIIILVLFLSRRRKNKFAAATATSAAQNYPYYVPFTPPAPAFNDQTAYTNGEMSARQPTETAGESTAPQSNNPEAVPEPAKPTSASSEQVSPLEPDINASVPTISLDPPKHFNPYAPQPMSWQAFQELASPTEPVSYESYNPSEEPTTYEPISEEKTERIQSAQTTENASFPSKEFTEDEKQDATDKFPKYN
jgi:Trypsin-like peptidase domain